MLRAPKWLAAALASVFLHVVGEEALEVYNNFQFTEGADEVG